MSSASEITSNQEESHSSPSKTSANMPPDPPPENLATFKNDTTHPSPTNAHQPSQIPSISTTLSSIPSVSHQPPPPRINKNDALNYLDQVKTQFHDRPEVYNKFLEIMKDFKAHTIDTNTVVERVSSLFEGHSSLIEGFNAFLPQESRIKMNRTVPSPGFASPSNILPGISTSGMVRPPVLTPSTSMDYQTPQLPHTGYHAGYYPHHATTRPQSQQIPSTSGPSSTYYPSQRPPTIPQQRPNLWPSDSTQPPHYHSQSSTQPSMSTPNIPSHVHPEGSTQGRKPSMGMIQAVSYLRKIQERFFKQPEIYQAFVDILRSYQKEQRPIREVYHQVSTLFAGHQDLLDEFAQFIPDSQTTRGPAIGSQPFPKPSYESMPMHQPVSKRGRGASTMKRTVSPPLGMEYQKKRSRFEPLVGGRPMGELEFFERVKRFFNHNEQIYGEFLKCLNWYTQDIIKKSELVNLVHSFIGRNEELFNWFKVFIGYHPSDSTLHPRDRKDDIITDSYLLDLSSCKRIVSYRFLPRNYQQPACSGRAELCNEVLNDSMISCPSFTSEDSTFVSSKKNMYEEALFRCEDERYELDRLIDGTQSTLMSLEHIWKKLSSMNTKDVESYTLTDTLGGTSEIIHKAIIGKIYGAKADEVMDALKRTPYIALPIVMKRLRQKDEEWRIAQREWNKIWRDIHYKNYYKALDNQSVNFKSTDKKVLSIKSLVNEIQTIYHEQYRDTTSKAPLHLLPSSQGLSLLEKMAPAPPVAYISSNMIGNTHAQYHMEFKFNDKGVFVDLLKLLLCYIIKTNAFNSPERKSLWKFVMNFIPDFFSMKASLDDHESSNKNVSSTSDQNGTWTIADEYMCEKLAGESSTGTCAFDVVLKPCSEVKRSEFANFNNHYNIIYGNDSIYTLFRLVQIAYHRLEQMKILSISCQDNNPLHLHKKNYVATFLDIQKKHMSGSSICSDYYTVLLEMILALADGTLEQSIFEEKIRLMFGAYSYLMFTFDRVLLSLLKTIVTILSDTMCEHIIALYDSYKRPGKGNIFSEYAYKVAASSLVTSSEHSDTQDGNIDDLDQGMLFRVDSQKETHEDIWWLKFRYIPQPINTTGSESSWSSYIENYMDLNYNPDILKRKPRLLLFRNLKKTNQNRHKNMMIQFNLECKINVKTFKMYFVDHTEDFLFNYSKPNVNDMMVDGQPGVIERPNNFGKWLEKKLSSIEAK